MVGSFQRNVLAYMIYVPSNLVIRPTVRLVHNLQPEHIRWPLPLPDLSPLWNAILQSGQYLDSNGQ
jgi:hypothetical protein